VKISLLQLALGLMLVGCASSPATIEYFLIDPASSDSTAVEVSDGAGSVVLEAIEMPGFLTQAGLVMQSGDNQISVSRTHLWAERLDKALSQVLVKKLQHGSEAFIFYQGDSDWIIAADYRIRLRIDNFHPTAAGEAVSSGSYQLMDTRSGQSTPPRYFSFSRDLQADGYAESVVELDYLLGQIADLILAGLDAFSLREPGQPIPPE
jgi:uncharacterized lipoprotein YmbA